MSHKHVVHEYEIAERGLFVNLSTIALVISGIGLLLLLVIILAYIWPLAGESRETSTEPATTYTNALEMQYAEPWLAMQNNWETAVGYTNALEMQYAEPWLAAQNSPANLVEYNNALELFYAKNWQHASQLNLCHSRMDYAYACQYGRWLPVK